MDGIGVNDSVTIQSVKILFGKNNYGGKNMKKKIISMITAIAMIIGIVQTSAGAVAYNTNLFTDGDFNGTPNFKYNYLNIGNLVILSGFEQAPGTDLANKKQVEQYSEDNGNKYLGIKTDKTSTAANGQGNMTELTVTTYDNLLEENTLFKVSMRIKVPKASIHGRTAKAMLVPKRQNNAYDPILCNRFGIPADVYPDGNIGGHQGDYTQWDGYYQTLTADEWTTLETYYKIKNIGNGEKRVNIDLKADTNRLKGWEFYIDDLRLEAVDNTIEPLSIKSADGNNSFEIKIPKFNEPDNVSSYYAELRINNSEIYNDVNWSLASLTLPENHGYKGVSIVNNKLTVSSEAVASEIKLIAKLPNGLSVDREVRLIPQTDAPEARNLNVVKKQNGDLAAGYTFYDPMGGEDNSTYQWYYYESETSSSKIPVGTTKTISVAPEYQNGYFTVEVTPKSTAHNNVGAVVTSMRKPYAEQKPTAKNITVSGKLMGTETVTGSYTFYDVNDDLEDKNGTEFAWFVSPSKDGTYTKIKNANKISYQLTENEEGKYIRFGVKPRSLTGANWGADEGFHYSEAYGPVAEYDRNLFLDGGFEKGSYDSKNNYVSENGTVLLQPEGRSTVTSEEKHSGNRSIYVKYTNNLKFPLNLKKNTLYQASAWVKINSDSKASFASFENTTDRNTQFYYDAMDKTYLTESGYFATNTATYLSPLKWDEWVYINRIFYIPDDDKSDHSEATYVMTLITNARSTGDNDGFWVDDLLVNEFKPKVEVYGPTEAEIGDNTEAKYSIKAYIDSGRAFIDANSHAEFRLKQSYPGLTMDGDTLKITSGASAGIKTIIAKCGLREVEYNVNLKFSGNTNPVIKSGNLKLNNNNEIIIDNYNFFSPAGNSDASTREWFKASNVNGPWTKIDGQSGNSLPNASGYKTDGFVKVIITPKDSTGKTGEKYESIFSFSPAIPTVSDISINGEHIQGSVIKADYRYIDMNGDEEGGTVIDWYRADSANGTYTKVSSQETYTLAAADSDKFIKCIITPKNAAETGTPSSLSDVEPFEGPARPTASNVRISGKSSGAGYILTGEYTYEHKYGVKEGKSRYSWYLDGSKVGSSANLQITDDMVGKKIAFGVTPVAEQEPCVGNEVLSGYRTIISSNSLSIDISDLQNPDYGYNMYEITANGIVRTDRGFKDIIGHWAKDSIVKMIDLGIVNGVSDTSFEPDRTVTRAEFCKLVCRTFGITDYDIQPLFKDVDSSAWYFADVQAAAKAGLVQGFDGYFNPEDKIERQAAAQMLLNVCNIKELSAENSGDTTEFDDNAQISDWAKEAVEKLTSMQVIKGNGGSFLPKASATRAEAVVMISRLVDNTGFEILTEITEQTENNEETSGKDEKTEESTKLSLKDAVIDFLGDSITQGVGVQDESKRYDNVILAKAGAKSVHNYGQSGTRIAEQITPSPNESFDVSFAQRAAEMNPDANVIIVFGGTNDYGHGDAPFGEMTDTEPTTYCGAVDNLMKLLKDKYPEAQIVFLTPARREGDESASTEWQKTNGGKPLKDYCEVIKQKGAQYDIPVLDVYEKLGINPNNEMDKYNYTTDGLHLNEAGHEKLADLIIEFINNL